MRTRLRLAIDERDMWRRSAEVAWRWAAQMAERNVDMAIRNLDLALELDARDARDMEREADEGAAGNDHDRHPYVPEATIRFTTQSGATYLLRDDGTHASLMRESGPMNAWIHHGNGEWMDVVGTYTVALGESSAFELADGLTAHVTTPVVAIDVVAPDE